MYTHICMCVGMCECNVYISTFCWENSHAVWDICHTHADRGTRKWCKHVSVCVLMLWASSHLDAFMVSVTVYLKQLTAYLCAFWLCLCGSAVAYVLDSLIELLQSWFMTGRIWESVIQCQVRAEQCPQIFLFSPALILSHTLTAVEMNHVVSCTFWLV